MKSVVYVLVLLIGFTYVFAIALTQLSEETEFGVEYFDTVPLSMYSLLIYACLLDDLSDFCNAIKAESYICFVLVIAFISLASLTVMNMLVGVLCEVIQSVAQTEKEERLTTLVYDQMGSVVKKLDKDFNGKLSYKEFCAILEYPDALLALQQAGVDPIAMVDFGETMFCPDGYPVEISFEKFMSTVLDLRGSNMSTVKDLMSLWKQVKNKISESERKIRKHFEGRCEKLQSTTEKLAQKTDQSIARLEAEVAVVKSSNMRIENQLSEVLALLKEGRGKAT
eukprot:gnl/TRDRNA2_/TRDRNA2_125540_c0_seq1.p1 gnl/TRDRNA2_/TRDRNA2_125540_c0~~gnl/TRDRNA2_/TRDRNA2_125540_c0_seq1.p1  ORF type:complete len:295 (-),score=76.41 gnl/TRDRNA2_/TRDRNA2_125540_c0_seq1:61-903(-)